MAIFKTILFTFSITLSILGWISYGRFVYITSIDPDLGMYDFDRKYFSSFPTWLNGMDKTNLATVIILTLAILLIVFSGFLNKKFKFFAYIILITDGVVIGMLAFAYM